MLYHNKDFFSKLFDSIVNGFESVKKEKQRSTAQHTSKPKKANGIVDKKTVPEISTAEAVSSNIKIVLPNKSFESLSIDEEATDENFNADALVKV